MPHYCDVDDGVGYHEIKGRVCKEWERILQCFENGLCPSCRVTNATPPALPMAYCRKCRRYWWLAGEGRAASLVTQRAR